MATAMNCTVKVYRGVPLVKGGTEVLYLSGGSAEGALGGYAIRTYTQYYYTREDEGKIQVDDDIANLEGANYVSFANLSHGGKVYCGFIDHLRYVNDSTTEIQFTIDPFATFVGDCTESSYVHIIRNTVKNDIRGKYVTNDYLPNTSGGKYTTTSGQAISVLCNEVVMYYVVGTDWGVYIKGQAMQDLPVSQYFNPTASVIKGIIEDGGTILGAYLVPSGTSIGTLAVSQGADISVSFPVTGYRNLKCNTGVYHKYALTTTQGVKYYDMEDFANPTSVTFGRVHYSIPTPSILIYPKNYRGVADNLAEGLTIQLPSIPVGVPTVYTQAQAVGDVFGIAGSAITGAVSGAHLGGWVGALVGAGSGIATGIAGIAMKNEMNKYSPMGVTQTNFPLINSDYTIKARIDVCSPKNSVMEMVDDYFDYYGYNIDAVLPKTSVNTDDGAYLQTGTAWLSGSEADDEINARMMNGIKIRKTL